MMEQRAGKSQGPAMLGFDTYESAIPYTGNVNGQTHLNRDGNGEIYRLYFII